MLRTLRAFLWMRWRILANAFKSGRRDRMEQISRALSVVAPFLVASMLVPSATGLALAAFVGGRMMAAEGTVHLAGGWVTVAMRVVLVVVFIAVVISPMVRAGRGSGSAITRLMLLPVRRSFLHVAEVFAALSDPWLAILVPGLLMLPVGLASAGSFRGALAALVGAVLFLAVLVLVASTAGFVVALIFRRRQRAEWVTLVLVVLLSLSGLFAALWGDRLEQKLHAEREAQRLEQSASDGPELGVRPNDRVDRSVPAAVRAAPSEMYVRLLAAGVEGKLLESVLWILGLSAWVGGLYYISRVTYLRLLETPETGGSSRRAPPKAFRTKRVPGCSPAVSAVALAQVRLALRTVRGKTGVYLNVVVLVLMYFVFLRPALGSHLPDMLGAGMLIALGGLFFTLLSLQPVLVNQFAVDETGLTLTFLAPLSSRQIVLGKLVGGGILTAISTALCFLAGLVLVPAGHPLLWLATGVTAIASYLVFAPFCLLLSAVLPKTADLSRLGKDGNPQPVASFVATFGVPLVLAPPVLAVAVAVWVMESPLVGLVASLVWLGFAALVGREFLRAASAALSRRREAILLVATGR